MMDNLKVSTQPSRPQTQFLRLPMPIKYAAGPGHDQAHHDDYADEEQQLSHGCLDMTTTYWNTLVWHGGSIYDAWLNAVSAQVGQVILSMPSSFAQIGITWGIVFQLLYAAIGMWTCYILSALYLEYRQRREKEGATFHQHVIQYPEVMGYLVGHWARGVALFFNAMSMASMAVVQLIACASNVYYLNAPNTLNKRQWTLVFGAISLLTVLIPTMHNFRVFSFLGAVTTTYTAWYMFLSAIAHGQVPDVKHSAPQNMQLFFTGTTNLLFAFGGHAITVERQLAIARASTSGGLNSLMFSMVALNGPVLACREIMHAMWKPRSYKWVYVMTVLYVLTITLPHSVAIYWAYGDLLLHKSNAFALLPKSKYRDAGIILMILHQAIAFGMYMMPLNLTWEKTVGVHQSRFLWRVFARIPIALLLWLTALALPFFGPLNSIIGSLITSFATHIIPCAAYLITFRSSTARLNAADKPGTWRHGWSATVIMNFSIIALILTLGTAFGSWASISNLTHELHSFGMFEPCYQC